MEVFAFDRDEAVLDLLVHFLGIATHHNINAAPSKVSTHGIKLRAVKQLSGDVREQDTALSLHPINVHVLKTVT